MTWDQWLVTAFGLGLIPLIVWFFWIKRDAGTHAQSTGSHQEVQITVKGGYTPDTIIVQKNRPVRLNFLRQESATCSDTVIIPEFGKSAQLPQGETIAVEFIPDKSGEFEFTCQMGMLRGRLIIEEA
ncbi:cupredoxin domain-containing protein [Magnetovibrio sp. PR-2]|uniref:cupredoxin domain-containing protein n=1 Tax=Magnetovibrio sp. PR-2 TaxID=3120356 RepID=UPI002FCE177C